MTVEIICADARQALARFPDGHFHCCISSPPFWGLRDYGLEPTVWGGEGCEHEWGSWQESHDEREATEHSKTRTTDRFYGDESRRFDGNHQKHSAGAFCRRCNAWRGTLGLEPTPELYVEHLVGVMREVLRVLRDDGTLWLNLGDSYTSTAQGTFNAPQPKGSRVNAQQWANYRPFTGLKPKDLVGVPWMVAFALRADGWWLRSDIIWSKPNPMPESVRDRPTRSHEYLFLLTKRERYAYDQDAIREPAQNRPFDASEKTIYPNDTAWHDNRYAPGASGYGNNPAGRNRRSVWEIATQPFPGAHFAVFPEKLVEPCILAGTSEWGCCPECGAPWERVVEKGTQPHPNRWSKVPNAPGDYQMQSGNYDAPHDGLGMAHTSETVGWRPTCKHGADPVPCRVLDPFAGSGTVGVVAERLGRHSVLIDAKEEYCEMARQRTAQRGLMVEAAS